MLGSMLGGKIDSFMYRQVLKTRFKQKYIPNSKKRQLIEVIYIYTIVH